MFSYVQIFTYKLKNEIIDDWCQLLKNLLSLLALLHRSDVRLKIVTFLLLQVL